MTFTAFWEEKFCEWRNPIALLSFGGGKFQQCNWNSPFTSLLLGREGCEWRNPIALLGFARESLTCNRIGVHSQAFSSEEKTMSSTPILLHVGLSPPKFKQCNWSSSIHRTFSSEEKACAWIPILLHVELWGGSLNNAIGILHGTAFSSAERVLVTNPIQGLSFPFKAQHAIGVFHSQELSLLKRKLCHRFQFYCMLGFPPQS